MLMCRLVTGEAQSNAPTTTTRSPPLKNSLFEELVQFDEMDEEEEDDDEDDNNSANNVPAIIEDEEEYLDDDDFYTQHPVRLPTNQLELGSDIKVNDTEFDDHEVFETNKFYSADPAETTTRAPEDRSKPNVKMKESSNISSTTTNTTTEPKLAQSSEEDSTSSAPGVGLACALVLARGDCITYAALEWAIRRAKRLVGYQRPAGLNSLDLSESTVGAVGQLNEMTSRLLASRFQLNYQEIGGELERIDVSQTSLWRDCPRLFRDQRFNCNLLSRYRTHSGRCNNPLGAHLGSTNMPFVRMLPPEYGDGVGAGRRSSLTGNQLPPPRLVAINLHMDLETPASELSVLFMSWGQLINHDLAQASTARDSTGHDQNCCSRTMISQLARPDLDFYLSNCMPILMAPGDPVYGPSGVRCHEFKRSVAGLRPVCSLGPRTQINTITSFVDASFVYGSSSAASRSLRSGGQLDMLNYFERIRLKPLLPAQVDSPDEECIGREAQRRSGLYCFRSGDARTNQQIQLVVLHTIHARQHNRLAAGLATLNPHWSARRVYHEARHIHIALVQHILVSEYLPELLGQRALDKYHLRESGEEWLAGGYNANLNVGISQEFAAAAFRQGHLSVPSQVFRFNPVSHEMLRFYPLRRVFRQPWALFEPGAVDEFLAGMVDVPSKNLDPFMTSELSGHLLEVPGEQVGLDLASMNIQRGRDQGVAGYNAFREWCGLKRARDFADLDAYMSNRSSFLMSQLYESVDDIDLFTGGASEFPLDGAQVGPTFACIIGRQFEILRAGDRFWFENGPQTGPQAFTVDQLASIKQVSLARLLCVNSDSQFDVQPRAFRLAHPVLNPRQPCYSLPDLDLTLWWEPAAAAAGVNPGGDNDADDGDEDDK